MRSRCGSCGRMEISRSPALNLCGVCGQAVSGFNGEVEIERVEIERVEFGRVEIERVEKERLHF